MTICELIEQLQQFNQNSTVVVRYEEGHGIGYIEAVAPGRGMAGGLIEIVLENK